MSNLFIQLYNYLSHRRVVMWSLLFLTTLLMGWGAMQVRYEENIVSFFPKQAQDLSLIYENLPAKEKLVVMFTTLSEPSSPSSGTENSSNLNQLPTTTDEQIDRLIAVAETFSEALEHNETFKQNATLTLRMNEEMIESISDFVYDYLPLWLTSDQLTQLDSLFSDASLAASVRRNYDQLFSPIGGYIADHIYQDPLSLGGNALGNLQKLGSNVSYQLVDDYIFSPDRMTLFCYIDPIGKRSSSTNAALIETIERTLSQINKQHPTVHADYFGAPAVAVYNARQIKQDSMVTLNIAILLVVLCMAMVFKNRMAPLLVLLPVLYGALFSLSMIYLLTGEISLIAVGAGSVVLGIALSYSIHLLTHANHSRTMQQVIGELTYPLTVGSLTTIGAFVGLLFTNSKLLQDFGLFASLTLVGTTLFVLIFLPHLLRPKGALPSTSRILTWVDRLCSKPLHQSRVWVWGIVLITVLLGSFSGGVKFDSDMMSLNYTPPHLQAAEERLNRFMGVDSVTSTVLFMASAPTAERAITHYKTLCAMLDSLQMEGKVVGYSSIHEFVIPTDLQQKKLEIWSRFWEQKSPHALYRRLRLEAEQVGFEHEAYDPFYKRLVALYRPLTYDTVSPLNTYFKEWISVGDSLTSFVAQVKLNNTDKEALYACFANQEGIAVVDRAFFASKMAESVNENFYLILYLSGLLVFFALLLSYGRIELTLISFLPMCVSWLIILGLMSLCGIDFNIVSIILSTFIFGIGDDFSIFIMDGLLNEYRDKKQLLIYHKTAIFFSAFAVLIGMGSLIFAKHPAVHSLSIISVVGIVVVVLVAYILQPFVFRVLISSPAQRGGFPYTWTGLLRSFYAFTLFVLGCLLVQLFIWLFHLVPVSAKRRKTWVHHFIHRFIRFFLWAMFMIRKIQINQPCETFAKPAIIIANHQSFIDILVMISLHPKLVMVTKEWVWRSPIFGRIVRYLDFYHAGHGEYETLVSSLQRKVEEGYSVVIFPEGTRSADCKIKRFHKGAFYLAEVLKLDILPILLYGNGLVSAKQQPLHIKCGMLVSKILPRIPFVETSELSPQMSDALGLETSKSLPTEARVSSHSSISKPINDDVGFGNTISASATFGVTYQERTKRISAYLRDEYKILYEEYNRASNPYFRKAIVQNYIYKGPVLEWYMRIKLRMEGWYDQYDRFLPRRGKIVDLGCGYGAMSYMLALLSDERELLGIDYDEKKITLANHAFLKRPNICFVQADLRNYDIPPADAYILSDVLHYMDNEAQRKVIESCMARLQSDGTLIIREGDASMKRKHARTEETERWSTQILKFNKSEGALFFLSRTLIEDIAQRNSMKLEIVESNSRTSNTLFILKHANR